jgi:hypothetical protein
MKTTSLDVTAELHKRLELPRDVFLAVQGELMVLKFRTLRQAKRYWDATKPGKMRRVCRVAGEWGITYLAAVAPDWMAVAPVADWFTSPPLSRECPKHPGWDDAFAAGQRFMRDPKY